MTLSEPLGGSIADGATGIVEDAANTNAACAQRKAACMLLPGERNVEMTASLRQKAIQRLQDAASPSGPASAASVMTPPSMRNSTPRIDRNWQPRPRHPPMQARPRSDEPVFIDRSSDSRGDAYGEVLDGAFDDSFDDAPYGYDTFSTHNGYGRGSAPARAQGQKRRLATSPSSSQGLPELCFQDDNVETFHRLIGSTTDPLQNARVMLFCAFNDYYQARQAPSRQPPQQDDRNADMLEIANNVATCSKTWRTEQAKAQVNHITNLSQEITLAVFGPCCNPERMHRSTRSHIQLLLSDSLDDVLDSLLEMPTSVCDSEVFSHPDQPGAALSINTVPGQELMRVKRPMRMATGGSSYPYVRTHTLPLGDGAGPSSNPQAGDDPQEQTGLAAAEEADDSGSDFPMTKTKIHPHDFGLTDQVFSCSGALMATMGRARSLLWAPAGLPAAEWPPNYLEPGRFIRYNWSLHDTYLATLQLPCQHSMLHASLAVPVFTLRFEGMDEQRGHLPSPYKDTPWPEPSFPFSAVEHDLPIPPASYLCARAQQAYACEYIGQMRDGLPNVTDMGCSAQRQQPLQGRFRFYSRDRLAKHAHLVKHRSTKACQALVQGVANHGTDRRA